MNYKCLICQIKSLEQRFEKFRIAEQDRDNLMGEIIEELAKASKRNFFSPETTRSIIARLKGFSNIKDPYAKEKEEGNQLLLKRYDEFKALIATSADPFNTALRLAVAGNIIDFGPTTHFDIESTINKVLASDFAIDHSLQLKDKISQAKTILYLGDNCGEIVLDKLFLETISHPNVWFAHRDSPILNDATEKEALEVGINKYARLISNGDDSPSTLLHRVSNGFREIYNTADLIISKGMGNYEGLMYEKDRRLFYLLMIKCPVIAEKTGTNTGDFVVMQNQNEAVFSI